MRTVLKINKRSSMSSQFPELHNGFKKKEINTSITRTTTRSNVFKSNSKIRNYCDNAKTNLLIRINNISSILPIHLG